MPAFVVSALLTAALSAVEPTATVAAPEPGIAVLVTASGPELRLGMTRSEVVGLVGEPDRTQYGAEYLRGGFAVIYDRADTVGGLLAGQSSSPGPLSEAFLGSIQAIRMGSTRREVEMLMGAPAHARRDGLSEYLTYTVQGLVVQVQLTDDRVHHLSLLRDCRRKRNGDEAPGMTVGLRRASSFARSQRHSHDQAQCSPS